MILTACLNKYWSSRTGIIYVTDVTELVNKNCHTSNKAGSRTKHHIQHSTRQGEIDIIFEVSPNDSWRNLDAMSVFLVFVILPPANIQIAIFVIIWWQNGKKSINDLSPVNKSVSKVGLSVIPFMSSFR